MSLNFQFTDKERFNKFTDQDKKLNDAFIWGCMMIDLGEITEKNAEEWQWRYAYMVQLNGAYYYRPEREGGEAFVPTLEEVRKRIGLSTNVGNKTRNQFIQKMARIYSRK